MNILFVENALRPTRGGVERVTFTLFNGLINVGHKCYIYFREDDFDGVSADNKYRQHNLSGIYEQMEACIKRWDIHVLICQNLHTKEYQQAYARIRNEHKVKIISVLHSNPDIWVNKNKWGCTFPKIYFKELLRSVLFRIKGNPYKEQMLGMYNISDKYVLLSESFKKVFCDLYKVDGRKLYAIGNPCAFSDDLGCHNEKENIVVVVARMAEQQKRISNVLQIWAKAQNKVPGWNLCIVGDGPDLEEYKRLAQRNNLKNVTFVGASNEPEVYYKRAKIFMMTSIWEGYPMTLIEAQHYGCVPIVYDSFAAVHDLIKDDINGKIIPLHNIQLYASQLNMLMNTPQSLYNLSVAAIRYSNERYHKEIVLNDWGSLFEELEIL